jgi:hypothetical protein
MFYCDYKQLKSLASEHTVQALINAFSADSAIKTLVSAAFFNSTGNMMSILGSISRYDKFSNMVVMVKIAFLAS